MAAVATATAAASVHRRHQLHQRLIELKSSLAIKLKKSLRAKAPLMLQKLQSECPLKDPDDSAITLADKHDGVAMFAKEIFRFPRLALRFGFG